MTATTVAAFPDVVRARDAESRLLAGGIPHRSVGLVLADSADARGLLERGPGNPAQGAATGAAIGSAGMGAGALALAGLGVIATGPAIALLGAAAAGAAGGGLLVALVGLGMPRDEAVLRRDDVIEGGALVVVESTASEQPGVARLLAESDPVTTFRI